MADGDDEAGGGANTVRAGRSMADGDDEAGGADAARAAPPPADAPWAAAGSVFALLNAPGRPPAASNGVAAHKDKKRKKDKKEKKEKSHKVRTAPAGP